MARLTAAVRAAWTSPKPPAEKDAKRQGDISNDLDIPFTHPGDRELVPERRLPRKPTADYLPARDNLREYLAARLNWNPRDAALLIEYASLELGIGKGDLLDRWDKGYWRPDKLAILKASNLGPLSAIGEQKATQLFAQLASRFDQTAGTVCEAIFSAWGGDVRERSIDLATGRIRPREVAIALPVATTAGKRPPPESYDARLTADPTVYARIDYLDPNAKITKEERQSCLAILQNLPVVFTFAPMNLLYYQAEFGPHGTRAVTIRYRQYAYADTRGKGSYQVAYVLHPATLWKEFGPIKLTVQVPKGVGCMASTAIHKSGDVRVTPGFKEEELEWGDGDDWFSSGKSYQATVYEATLARPEEKNGELFVGVVKPAWDKMFPPEKHEKASQKKR